MKEEEKNLEIEEGTGKNGSRGRIKPYRDQRRAPRLNTSSITLQLHFSPFFLLKLCSSHQTLCMPILIPFLPTSRLNGSGKLRSSHLPDRRSPLPRPQHRNRQWRRRALRTPLRTKDVAIPNPTLSLRVTNPKSRHPRPTLPTLGNTPRFLSHDKSRVSQLEGVFEEETSGSSKCDMFGM